MSKSTFNALASLALLAGAPVVAQAEMVEMTETQMADVNGQGLVTGFITGAFGLPIRFPFPASPLSARPLVPQPSMILSMALAMSGIPSVPTSLASPSWAPSAC